MGLREAEESAAELPMHEQQQQQQQQPQQQQQQQRDYHAVQFDRLIERGVDYSFYISLSNVQV